MTATTPDRGPGQATFRSDPPFSFRLIFGVLPMALPTARSARRRFTPAEDAVIRRMAPMGVGASAIGHSMGRTERQVRARADRLGVKILPRPVKATAEMGRRIHDWVRATGKRLVDAQAHFDVSQDVAYAALRKAGLKLYPHGVRASLSPERIAEIHARHSGQRTVEQAARIEGTTRNCIQYAMRTAGLVWERVLPAPVRRANVRPHGAASGGAVAVAVRAVPEATAAAQFLGRWFRPVVRADIARLPYVQTWPAPDAYQVGRHVMPTEKMLELARAKGWAA